MRHGAKTPILLASSKIWRDLDRLSKGALIDLACDLIAQASESADEPVTHALAAQAVIPILNARGDAIPAWARTPAEDATRGDELRPVPRSSRSRAY